MVAHLPTPGEFGRSFFSVQKPPMTADRAFELALPGLVESLDQIRRPVAALRRDDHFVHDPGLGRERRERPVAQAAGAWPADLADHHLLARKARRRLGLDFDHVAGGLPR